MLKKIESCAVYMYQNYALYWKKAIYYETGPQVGKWKISAQAPPK